MNYALGHGGRDDVATPRRVDFTDRTDVSLEKAGASDENVRENVRENAVSVSCSKYHSVVAFRDGSVCAWGHGRGGRLGVMDAGVHDGDVAALRPTEVFFPEPELWEKMPRRSCLSFPSRTHFVTRVAAGKHHTLATTRGGALFSWGRAADGRLGYDVRDCDVQDDAGGAYQRTPRLVLGALRDAFVVDVAAANRHSAATTRAGEVFAFGSNAHGQLGRRPKRAFERESLSPRVFGSREGETSRGSPSASPKQRDAHAFLGGSSFADGADAAAAKECESREWSPAAADALKPLGRVFVGVSASKRHTVVLDAAGAVYQFGQGDYSPRRVALKEDERSSSSSSAAAAAAAAKAAGANVSLARGARFRLGLVLPGPAPARVPRRGVRRGRRHGRGLRRGV